jgi:hypothetical protein
LGARKALSNKRGESIVKKSSTKRLKRLWLLWNAILNDWMAFDVLLGKA